MTFQDIINYYLNHPPFEVTDTVAYQEMVNIISQITVHELSENDPILDETKLTTTNSSDPYILMNLSDIDPNIMEIIVMFETNNPPPTITQLMYQYFGSSVSTPYIPNDWSLVNMVAADEALYVLREWFTKHSQKLIFKGTKIKVKPSTEYYFLYYRYRNIDELPISLLNIFKQLLEINLMLGIYQSDIFSSEGGIRSVSLSGLSVSFNVPSSESKVNSLKRQKEQLLGSIAIDYGDDTVGLIF